MHAGSVDGRGSPKSREGPGLGHASGSVGFRAMHVIRPSPPRRRSLLLAAIGGALTTLSVPPFGWWPLAFAGIALLVLAADGAGLRRRFALGALFGLVLYGISLWWMTSFSLPGGLFVAALEATFTGVGLALAGRRSSFVCVPIGLVAADSLRSLWPARHPADATLTTRFSSFPAVSPAITPRSGTHQDAGLWTGLRVTYGFAFIHLKAPPSNAREKMNSHCP